jgi:hypothetical protein
MSKTNPLNHQSFNITIIIITPTNFCLSRATPATAVQRPRPAGSADRIQPVHHPPGEGGISPEFSPNVHRMFTER